MVIGEYTPPAKAPCCAGCASPAERQALRRRGAALVLGRVGGRGGLRGEGEELGAQYVWTPGQLENLADQAQTEIWAIARDYSKGIASGAINHQQLAGFKAFYNEWEGYYGSLKAWYSKLPIFGGLMWGSTADRIEEYRRRASQWRDILIRSGGSSTAPAPLPPNKGDGSAIKWIAGGAIVLGGAYALGKIITLIPKPRSA